jgi:hypothetical protein
LYITCNVLVAGRKKKRKTRNEVGKGSGKYDEAEEFNTWGSNEPATIVKSDREPVTDVTLEN